MKIAPSNRLQPALLSHDYFNELQPLITCLEVFNIALTNAEHDVPSRKSHKAIDLRKVPEAIASRLLGALSLSVAPLLLRKIKSYEQYEAEEQTKLTQATTSSSTIPNKRLKAKLAKRIEHLYNAAEEKLHKADGNYSITLYPQRIISILVDILKILDPSRENYLDSKKFPLQISFKGISAEQLGELKSSYLARFPAK